MIEMRWKRVPRFDPWDGWYDCGDRVLQYREGDSEWKNIPEAPLEENEIEWANEGLRKGKIGAVG